MSIDRRTLIAALGLSAAATPLGSAADTPNASANALAGRINARALESRTRLAYDGGIFAGPAYDLLVGEARRAQYFCIGEEHGIAENPKLAAQIFSDAHFERAYVELSAPMAEELDRAAVGGVSGISEFFYDPGRRVAFFGMQEEAEWAVAVRRSRPRADRVIYGLDYEVSADRRLIARLKTKRKPPQARRALEALEAASNAAWAQHAATHNPQFIFSFSGDPALVDAVRRAWPQADDEARLILETLEETLHINRLWVSNQAWASNERRAAFNRANLRRRLNEVGASAPRAMLKFGASHMARGLSYAQVLDLGTQISEAAYQTGRSSFHVMVLPGAGRDVAQFDPSAFVYRAAPPTSYRSESLVPLLEAAFDDAFTCIDLRPLRPLVYGPAHKALDADLVRVIHGFDALLVLSGSTPSQNLT